MDEEPYQNLVELTGHESGMLLFDSREFIIANWNQIKGIPYIFYGGLVGYGDKFDAAPCDVPSEMIEAMQAHEVAKGGEPSTDGFHAWEIFEGEGYICTVATQETWD